MGCRGRSFVAGIAALVGASACSLLASTGGLSGGDFAAEGDAASGPGGGGRGDASPGGTDAEAGGGPTSCPPGAIVCDDFERAELLPSAWGTSQGLARITTDKAASGTRSFGVELAANGTLPMLTKQIDPAPGKARLAMSLWVGKAIGGSNGFALAHLAYGPPNKWDTFGLAISSGGLVANGTSYDGGPSPIKNIDQTLLTAAKLFGTGWHRLVIDVDLTVNPRSLVAEVDGVTLPALTMTSTQVPPTSTELQIGLIYGDTGTAYDGVYFDDVVFVAR